MQLIRGIHNLTRHPILANGCVLAIGNFDGVHLGHKHILKRLLDKSKHLSLPSVVMLFEPQPREFFARNNQNVTAPARLMRLRDKLYYLREMGIDYVICLRFNAKFAEQSPEQFVQNILVEKLNVKYLSVGDDFRFGKNRQGDFQFLNKVGAEFGFQVDNSNSYCLDGLRISSSLIRDALKNDDLDLVEKMLGKPYSIRGRVAHGNKLGRTIGFPTANIMLNRLVIPIQGVYAVSIKTDEGDFFGVANVGNRPTINGTKPILEVHIFNFSQAIYGESIEVSFLKKIRSEIKFESFEALKNQIEQDAIVARSFVERAE
ncbi:bifunctional riboflavin kinase/FAD synthetase [Otariodibacter oris]|uniref:Riboflavin biosynthesis protein n=1 Tax=Otariodibacter oris TaxID=1032623 RepID=A0A420XFH3_9PAST|nr:bifunctional riboflavin kinase/FAD synthetase [Otariodibacter oris]QGM80213.1 riboflavin biosynthesis protein RibF [Otariodibacter oris]RKR71575.1 riboflavin kinase/FMN adenylyltransferase [Otariodibacter oris]